MTKSSEARQNVPISYSSIILNLSLLFNIIAITSLVTTAYILCEKFFYFWDYSNYSSQTSELSSAFKASIWQGIDMLRGSFINDYNKLPCLPIVPFVLVFGDSRLTFILGCALIYIVPFALVAGAIATKIIFNRTQIVFWLTAFLTLLVPETWMSILRGYPDLGGATLIGLAILVYFQKGNQYFSFKKSWLRIPLIGLLLALSMLFRRHFAYSVRAFIIACILQALFTFFTNVRSHPHQSIRNLFQSGLFIFLMIMGAVVSLAILAPDFLHKILTTNFRSLYASYERSPEQNFQFYVQTYGILIWVLSILGFSLGLSNSKKIFRSSLGFIVLFGTISIVQWIFFSRQLGLHYSTHFTLFVVLGIILFVWICWSFIDKKVHILFGTIVTLLLVGNLVVGLTSMGEFNNSFRELFSTTSAPLFRSDYDQVINSLRNLTAPFESIYVGASSNIINHTLIRDSEKQLYNKDDVKLNVSPVPEIDSRDFYPLQFLLDANYVLIASPFQYTLLPQEQQVVEVVFDVFNQNQKLSQDFQKLPQQFSLDQGVVVDIYKRVRPTSFETAFSTLQNMRERIKPEPGQETKWLLVSSSSNTKLNLLGNNNSSIVNGSISLEATLEKGAVSLVYFGSMPKSMVVSGEIKYNICPAYKRTSLQLSLLSETGELIGSKKINDLSKSPSSFSESFQETTSPTYLKIELMGEEPNIDSGSSLCSLFINKLSLSPA